MNLKNYLKNLQYCHMDESVINKENQKKINDLNFEVPKMKVFIEQRYYD